MGGCQKNGPFLGTLNIRCRIIIGIKKRGHNFENHPYEFSITNGEGAGAGAGASGATSTWAPKVCKIMAFMAIIMGLGLLFYILLGFRYFYSRQRRSRHKQLQFKRMWSFPEELTPL